MNEDFCLSRRLIARTMNTKKLLPPLLFSMLGVACSQDRVMEEVTSTKVTDLGETVYSADRKVKLLIPAGAISGEQTILVTTREGLQYQSRVYDFEPDGLLFAKPVTIEFTGLSGENLVVAQIKDGQQFPLESSEYNNGVATAQLEHFSSYSIITVMNACVNLQCGDSCNWCDPNNPNCVEPPFPKACGPFGFCTIEPPGGHSCNGPQRDGGVPDAIAAPDAQVDAGVPFIPDSGLDGGNTGAYEETEPNNSQAEANVIADSNSTYQTIHGAILPSGDVDYYVFDVVHPTADLNARTHSVFNDPQSCDRNTDTVLTLYDANGNVLAMNDDGSTAFCSEIYATLTMGTYYIAVSGFVTQTVPSYYLTISLYTLPPGHDAGLPGPDAGIGNGDAMIPDSFFPPFDAGRPDSGPISGDASFIGDSSVFPQPDAGTNRPDSGLPPTTFSEVEPNNSTVDANPIGVVQGGSWLITASINPAGDLDFFQVDVPPATIGNLHAITYTTLGDTTACLQNADTYLEVQDSAGNVLVWNDDVAGRRCSEVNATLGTGTYFVVVRHFNQAAGTIPNYYLNIDL